MLSSVTQQNIYLTLLPIYLFMNVTKISLTRCQIFHLKCTKFNFGWGSAPNLAEGAHSAPPDLLAGFGEGVEREKGGRMGGKKKERKGKERRKGERREGKMGREWEG